MASPVSASAAVETPGLAPLVAAGELPPVAERLPDEPLVYDPEAHGQSLGRHGGTLVSLIGKARDVRLLVVHGYARLVGYDRDFHLYPDILKSVEVEAGRSFTFRLRRGHRWSDGAPFTAEDFRYYWDHIANNRELTPTGPPQLFRRDGELARFTVIDDFTVRFAWSRPNPLFLPALAAARPPFIYRPAHYLKRFHADFAEPADLATRVDAARVHSWAALHNRVDNPYKFDNPDRPTLQPWANTTRPPATRFVARRNPYYHRIDTAGRQLPYIDRVILNQVTPRLIAARAASGEVGLQARNLNFGDISFLKHSQARVGYRTLLWPSGRGAQVALYPNLNVNDPVWRALNRDVRFRRALSMGIDRELVNQSLFFGLAQEGNNTALPDSEFYDAKRSKRWAAYDPDAANRLLDEIGLIKRDGRGTRLLADGRPMEIIIETAGEDTTQTDVLELVRETWAELGIRLFSKPLQREVFRNRIFSGQTVMSIWFGLDNGVPVTDSDPNELAPVSQQGLQWPKWGQYAETGGRAGEAPDLPVPRELVALRRAWLDASDRDEMGRIWRRMLDLNADRQFSIGIVAAVPQPVVVAPNLRNVPERALYNWDPGAYFGVYRADAFWFDE